ncbi:hypothetical protein [Candidatus Minimicrobia naudis]
MYKRIIKPILFLLTPDFTHKLTIFCGRLAQALPPIRWAIRKLWSFQDKSLQQEIDGVVFNNPIGLSAGFDKNVQLSPLMEDVGFGPCLGWISDNRAEKRESTTMVPSIAEHKVCSGVRWHAKLWIRKNK